MNKLFTKIKSWFKKPTQKKSVSRQKLRQTNSAAESTIPYQPINHQHYRKLIGKIAKRAIAYQRSKARERRKL